MNNRIQRSNIQRFSSLWKQHASLRRDLGCEYVLDLAKPSGTALEPWFVKFDGKFYSTLSADQAVRAGKNLSKLLKHEKIISDSFRAVLPDASLQGINSLGLVSGISDMRPIVGFIDFGATENEMVTATVWDSNLSAPLRFFLLSFTFFSALDNAAQQAVLEFWAGWVLSQETQRWEFTQAKVDDIILNLGELLRFPVDSYVWDGLNVPTGFSEEVRCEEDWKRVSAVTIPYSIYICQLWCFYVSSRILKQTVNDFKLPRNKYTRNKDASIEDIANQASQDFISQFEAREELKQVFKELSEGEKQAFFLKSLQYTRDEMADIKGVSPETVKTLLKRGRVKAQKFSEKRKAS